jgi:hypothetical protein
MKRSHCCRRGDCCLGGAIAALLLTSITLARTQTNNHEFKDSYSYMTNNVQRVPTAIFLSIMGREAGPVYQLTASGRLHSTR